MNKDLPRDDNGRLSAFAWPGGYPIFYISADSEVLCSTCACMAENEGLTGDVCDPQWNIVAAEINFEDEDLFCAHCGEQIESAYGHEGEEI